MAYDPGKLNEALSAAVGADTALIADLRRAFAESAQRQYDFLCNAQNEPDWIMACLRLKGLCASFGVMDVMALSDRALNCLPGDPAILHEIGDALTLAADELD